MHLAILHYHLNRGGVTQVIRKQLRALSANEFRSLQRIAILYGGRREAWSDAIVWPGRPLDVQLIPVDSLEYDAVRQIPKANPGTLARHLDAALRRLGMAPDETILHAHNHALGKNASLPGALVRLAEAGYRLLLQIHDFAEDFRPDNYRHLADMLQARSPDVLAERLYPQAPHIHYAVLNGRDRGILHDVFPDAARVHWLPNPIEGPGRLPHQGASRQKIVQRLGVSEHLPLVIYPVRGIRRKNVGEMLLWSAVLKDEASFAVTLRPINRVERVGFDPWVVLAERLGLPCRFGTGEAAGLQYLDNLAASDILLTTSVAEGFGMVFLEASLSGRPLVGRDLPDITADFRRQGVRFPWLSPTIRFPRDAVDHGKVLRGLVADYVKVQSAYGMRGNAAGAAGRAQYILEKQDSADFAMFTPALQAELIAQVSHCTRTREALRDANPSCFQLPKRHEVEVAALLAENAAVIEERFGLKPSGVRIMEVYEAILASPVGPLTPLAGGDAILDALLDLGRLHPVRLQA